MYTRYTPVLNSKTGMCRGIPIFFLILAPKHRLWVLVRTATSMFLTKTRKKKSTDFFFNFYNLRKICISSAQCISERMQNRRLRNGQTFTGARAFSRQKCFFRSFKVTNANIETTLEQMCCIHTRLVVCAQEHNDFSGGSP